MKRERRASASAGTTLSDGRAVTLRLEDTVAWRMKVTKWER